MLSGVPRSISLKHLFLSMFQSHLPSQISFNFSPCNSSRLPWGRTSVQWLLRPSRLPIRLSPTTYQRNHLNPYTQSSEIFFYLPRDWRVSSIWNNHKCLSYRIYPNNVYIQINAHSQGPWFWLLEWILSFFLLHLNYYVMGLRSL